MRKLNLTKNKVLILAREGKNPEEIANILGYWLYYVRKTFRKNNIPYYSKNQDWSQKEDNILKESYYLHGAIYCQQYVNRSKAAIIQRASDLGLKRALYTDVVDGKSQCSKCKNWLPLSDFHGCHIRSNGKSICCKICAAKEREKGKLKNLATPETKKIYCLRRILIGAKSRAKKRGLPFTLTLDWFIKNLPEKCPIFNIKLTLLEGQKTYGTDSCPSLDRIDNSKGYTEDNVVIISYRANAFKGTLSIDELGKMFFFYQNLKTPTPAI